MSCGVGQRRGWDPELLWLWRGPVAIAPIGPLAWDPLCATGVALEKEKKKKKERALELDGGDESTTKYLMSLTCTLKND